MQYHVMIDVVGNDAVRAITNALPQLASRVITPKFFQLKQAPSEWRFCVQGNIIAADLHTLADVLANIGPSFDTIRMGVAQ